MGESEWGKWYRDPWHVATVVLLIALPSLSGVVAAGGAGETGAEASNTTAEGSATAEDTYPPIQYNETVTRTTDVFPLYAFSLSGSAGDSVSLDVDTRQDVDVLGISVYDCQWNFFTNTCFQGTLTEVATSAQAGDTATGNYSASVVADTDTGRDKLTGYDLPTDSTYTVIVLAGNKDESGNFTNESVTFDLTVTRGSVEDGRTTDLRSISYGETKSGYVDDSDPRNETFLGGHHYEPVTFSGQAGDVVAVRPEATDPGRFPSVRVEGPSGYLDRTATGQFALPETGAYDVKVGFLTDAPGNYSLTVRRVDGTVPAVTFDVDGNATAGDPVSFSATATADEPIESYEWTFGDGGTATGPEVAHTFDTSGAYTVEVVATDAGGDTGRASATVDVASVVESTYDDDGDGLDTAELEDVLADLPGAAGTDGDENTDGDGVPDGVEVGESRTIGPRSQELTVYELNSDPTDPNTDDGGLDDGEERRVGSDPQRLERSVVYAKLPMETDATDTIDTVGEGELLKTASLYTHHPQVGTNPPPWLRTAYEGLPQDLPDKSERPGTYMLVDVPVYVLTENSSSPVYDVTFESDGGTSVLTTGYRPGATGSDAYRWTANGYTGVREGSQVVSVILRSDQTLQGSGTLTYGLGQLSMKVRRPNDAPFARPSRDQVGSKYSVSSVSTDADIAAKNFGRDDVLRIYDESLGRVTTAAVNAVSLQVGSQTGSGANILLEATAVSGTAVVSGVLAVETASLACGATNSESKVPDAVKSVCTGGGPGGALSPIDITSPGQLPDVPITAASAAAMTVDGGHQIKADSNGNIIREWYEKGLVAIRQN